MKSLDKQAEEIVRQLRIEEKLAQLYSIWCNFSENGNIEIRSMEGFKNSYRKLDMQRDLQHGIGHIVRPLGSQPISAPAGVKALNAIQAYLVKHTRMGIPALPHEECLTGLMARGATLFPSGINNGSLWDEDLVGEIAEAIGHELRSVGSKLGLAPVLDVARDARWGRLEESMGEDPYLVGSLATAWVRNFQGPDEDIMATLKHFAGHSLPEGGRNHAPVRIGESELNDTMLLPFEMAVKLASPGALMPAYHDIDGVPLHASRKYLGDVLREAWKFRGLIVSDYAGIGQLHNEHGVAEDLEGAAALALEAGVDVEFPGNECFGPAALRAIEKGTLPVALVDRAVRRVLKEKIRLGLFDNPYTDEKAIDLRSESTRNTAYKAAAQSAVLLKNNGILPLDNPGSIALIGPLADDKMAMLSGYSFPVHLILSGLEGEDPELKTVRNVFEEFFPGKVSYSKGCDVLTERPKEAAVFPGDLSLDGRSQKSYISYDTAGFSEAVDLAGKSDTVIAVLGDLAGLFLTGTVGEGSDASSLHLPGVQHQLLESLLATGKPVIAVLVSGRPYSLGSLGEKCAALLQAWLPGMYGPEAILNILTGRENPSGRLPVSIVEKAGVMPYFYNHKLKSAGTPLHPDFAADYPFGHGLSYTSFSYSDWEIPAGSVEITGSVKGSFKITNTGPVKGADVIQIYVRDLFASRVRPVKELKGFKKVFLEPGETADVDFEIPVDMLNFTVDNFVRIVEPGDFEIMLAGNAESVAFSSVIHVTGEKRQLPHDWSMKSSLTIRRHI
ncbi:MAG: glycoside hydrolase family 3 C-terminal domain-containing protein [Spirochaetales bacterium]|nr:glycoside hydrolase family 3 C-terminal domain-containing protein [Spirochaetales bacterium]